MMSDFVLPRPSRYLVAAGTHDPTVVRCEQLRCSLTQWQAQSLPPGVFDQCLLFLHMRGSRCLSTLTVRVYSIEPGPIIVTRRTGNWLAEDELGILARYQFKIDRYPSVPVHTPGLRKV